MEKIHLGSIDYAVLLVYIAFVLGIGFALKRFMKTSADFFLSGRSIPAWVAGLAFISANLGAQELIGMSASGAKYGIMTSHLYWLGAIPAMVFVGIFMMPPPSEAGAFVALSASCSCGTVTPDCVLGFPFLPPPKSRQPPC